MPSIYCIHGALVSDPITRQEGNSKPKGITFSVTCRDEMRDFV